MNDQLYAGLADRIWIPTADLTYEQWQELRRDLGGLGGSDAAAVCGLDDRRGPYEVYMEKTGRLKTEREENLQMKLGKMLEPIVAQLFVDETGMRVWHPQALCIHPERRWQIANPDRFFEHPALGVGVLEIKTAGYWMGDEWANGEAPERALTQLLHYGAVTGATFGALAVLIGGQDFRFQIVEFDPDVIAMLTELEERFWVDHILADVVPPIDGSRGTTEFIRQLFPDEDGTTVEIDPGAVDILDLHAQLDAQIKVLEEQAKECENQVKVMLGDHAVGTVGGDIVATWKKSSPSKFDEKGFKAAHPGLHQEWSAPSPRRTFLNKRKDT